MRQGEQMGGGRRGDWRGGQKADTWAWWGIERQVDFIQSITEGLPRVLNREETLSNLKILFIF